MNFTRVLIVLAVFSYTLADFSFEPTFTGKQKLKNSRQTQTVNIDQLFKISGNFWDSKLVSSIEKGHSIQHVKMVERTKQIGNFRVNKATQLQEVDGAGLHYAFLTTENGKSEVEILYKLKKAYTLSIELECKNLKLFNPLNPKETWVYAAIFCQDKSKVESVIVYEFGNEKELKVTEFKIDHEFALKFKIFQVGKNVMIYGKPGKVDNSFRIMSLDLEEDAKTPADSIELSNGQNLNIF